MTRWSRLRGELGTRSWDDDLDERCAK